MCIQALFYAYAAYTYLKIPEYEELVMIALFFFIPVVSRLIAGFAKNIKYPKEFKYFSNFLLIVALVLFVVFTYITALGKAYQH